MALKGDRNEVETEVSYFMNEVAERGGMAVLSTAGSGAALDQSSALVTYAADPSGSKPVGLLLNDMVNVDQTRQHLNFYKNEVQKGGKVTLLRRGWAVTNLIVGTPTVGDRAYVGVSGYFTSTNGGLAATPLVGEFLSTQDEDGYAKVYVNMPGRVF